MSGNKFLTAFLHEQLKLIKEIALKLMDPNQCKDGYKIGIPFLSTVLNEFGTQDKQFINEIRYLFASLSFEKVREYLKMSKKYKLIESLLEEEVKFQNASFGKYQIKCFITNWISLTVVYFILAPVVYWICLLTERKDAKVFTASSVFTMVVLAGIIGLVGSIRKIDLLNKSWKAFWDGEKKLLARMIGTWCVLCSRNGVNAPLAQSRKLKRSLSCSR